MTRVGFVVAALTLASCVVRFLEGPDRNTVAGLMVAAVVFAAVAFVGHLDDSDRRARQSVSSEAEDGAKRALKACEIMGQLAEKQEEAIDKVESRIASLEAKLALER